MLIVLFPFFTVQRIVLSPINQGVELAEILLPKKVNFVTIKGGGHRNLADFKLFNQELFQKS